MRLMELGDGSAAEAGAMQAMFRARKEVFVDLLGWDVPVLDGRFEVDHFDDPHARYLILLDGDGLHRASTRLLATSRSHILGSLFPHLCDGAVPAGSNVVEITRFCLDRHQLARERLLARNRLVRGLVDYALANGIARYTGVAEITWFEQVRRFGWDCHALGRAHRHGSQTLVALRIDIDETTVDRMKAVGLYPHADTTPVPAAHAQVAA